MRFSYFQSFFSKTATPVTLAWDKFISNMKSISIIKGHKPSKDEYTQQGMISSGIYADNTARGNKQVIGWEMVMLDIDDCSLELSEIISKFQNYNTLIYSSPSCTKDKIKLRVCIELDSFASREYLSQVWFACNAWLDGIVDKQTKDPARMMYIPAMYDNKGKDYYSIFVTTKGKALDWKELIEKYPSSPEEEKYKASNKLSKLKRKIYLKNKKPPVTNIRAKNCPFVYKQMIDDYLLTPIGEHHLAIYKFMVKVCYNAQKIEYPLSIDELVEMAEQLDEMDGSYYDNKKLYNSAQDAIDYTGI